MKIKFRIVIQEFFVLAFFASVEHSISLRFKTVCNNLCTVDRTHDRFVVIVDLNFIVPEEFEFNGGVDGFCVNHTYGSVSSMDGS